MDAWTTQQLDSYENSLERYEELIGRERCKLEKYAQSDAARPGYIARMNRLLESCHQFYADSIDTVRTLVTIRNIQTAPPTGRTTTPGELEQLQRENRILKSYLRSLGKDPNVCMYLTERDFIV